MPVTGKITQNFVSHHTTEDTERIKITARLTHLAEPGTLLPEQRSVGNAARVHAAKGDAGAVVVSSVQFRDGHHVANLGILVGLRAEKGLAIGHRNGLRGALFEALELSEVGLGVNETST